MPRFLPVLCCLLCLMLGLSVGWYFGYTRPVIENQRKLLQIDQAARSAFHAAQEEFSNYEGRPGEFWEAAKVQDEFAAVVSLYVFRELERNDVQDAKRQLASTVGMYYRMHRRVGSSNVLASIEWVAATNAALSNAICRKPQ